MKVGRAQKTAFRNALILNAIRANVKMQKRCADFGRESENTYDCFIIGHDIIISCPFIRQ